MVHVHGAQAQQLAESIRGLDPAELVAVQSMSASTARWRWRVTSPGRCWPPRSQWPWAGVRLLVEWVQMASCGRVVWLVRVGVKAAGHYHQPLVSADVLAADWQPVQLSPAQVATQRQMTGRRRLKTDALDLVAISNLLRAGTARVIVSWPRRWASWPPGWPIGSGGSRPGPPSRTSSWGGSTEPSQG
jgi:Transposase